MSDEAAAIASRAEPVTVQRLLEAVCAAGLRRGDTALVHVAMSRIGWVPGGAQGVLTALLEALGPEGTLAMNGDSTQLSDPADWEHPPVPAGWVGPVRDAMPLFDPDLTPTRGLSRVNEAFRAMRATRRSRHPVLSLLTQGRLAEWLVAEHPLAPAQGAGSPLERLYEADAKVLLLGAGWESCTALHLAEHRVRDRIPDRVRLPIRVEAGRTIWQEVEEVEGFLDRFAEIGRAFETRHPAAVPGAMFRCARMRELVDFAVEMVDGLRADE